VPRAAVARAALKGLDIVEGAPPSVQVTRNAEGWVALPDTLEPYRGVLRWSPKEKEVTTSISLCDNVVVRVIAGPRVA